MVYICDVCQKEFNSPANLGSHKRIHEEKRAKSKFKQDRVEVDGSTVTVRHVLVVEQATRPLTEQMCESPVELYTCPDCNGKLEPMLNGPGLYVLRCKTCYGK